MNASELGTTVAYNLPRVMKTKSKDPNPLTQKTVKTKINLKGIGLHSGATVHCVIHPAPANHGVVFIRSDIRNAPKVKADISKVVRTDMCTVLGNEGSVVATVEHLMAAMTGMDIDNALIEISAPEIPIMDGSAAEFVKALHDAGVIDLGVKRKVLRLKEPVSVSAGDKLVSAVPAEDFAINCVINFSHPKIGEQVYNYSSGSNFVKEIASARTFGFLREVEYLHKKGLALGGSLDNAVVLDEERILNPSGLRFANEFVRHKILDSIGDFALLGLAIEAHISLHKSGHEMHAAFLRKVLSDPSCYEIVEAGAKRTAEIDEEMIADQTVVGAC